MSRLPVFNSNGNLPPGIHSADWSEIEARFGANDHRKKLILGLLKACLVLKAAGCHRVFIDGSFITSKDFPCDFDACWDYDGVDLAKLRIIAPSLFDFSNGRALQKLTYDGELFPSDSKADLRGRIFLDFFQQDKTTGKRKGIVVLNLGGLP